MYLVFNNKWSYMTPTSKGSHIFILASFCKFVRNRQNLRMEKNDQPYSKTKKILILTELSSIVLNIYKQEVIFRKSIKMGGEN